MSEPAVVDVVSDVLRTHARLLVDVDVLADDADLYEAGMSSHASVNVMLALEDAFSLEFPDELLSRSVFSSIDSLAAAIESLQVPAR
jgi:acyl carrier protein